MKVDSIACDVCGGGNSGAFNGYIPRFGRNQLTMGYDYKNLRNVSYRNEKVDFEFTQIDLGWRFFTKKGLYFNATLPLKSLEIQRAGQNDVVRGLGDLRIAMNYVWRLNKAERQWNTLIMLGTAWKATTGKYLVRDFSKQIMPLFLQNGSGANALQGTVYGQMANEHMGFWFNGLVQFNGVNEMQEKLGRRDYMQTGVFFHTQYFSFLKRSNQIWTNVSWLNERTSEMKVYDQLLDGTSNSVQALITQIDWYLSDWVVTFYAGQNMMSMKDTKIPISKWRMGINLIFVIPDRKSE